MLPHLLHRKLRNLLDVRIVLVVIVLLVPSCASTSRQSLSAAASAFQRLCANARRQSRGRHACKSKLSVQLRSGSEASTLTFGGLPWLTRTRKLTNTKANLKPDRLTRLPTVRP
jgi:hypothetical protein